MSRWSRPFLALERFYMAPRPLAPVACVRIGLGLIMALAYLNYFPHMEWMYGPDGLARAYWHHGEVSWLDHWMWPMWGLLITAGLCFAVGLCTPVSGLVLAACQTAFIHRFGAHTWGWASTIPLFIVYVSLSGAGRAWSLDAVWRRRRRARRGAPPEAPVRQARGWPVRLLQINVSAVYIAAAWHRVDDPSWLQGDIIWEALKNPFFTRWPHVDLQSIKPVLTVLSYVSWALEGLAVFLLWVPRLGPWWAVGCICMHLGLEASAAVGWWQYAMSTALLTFVWPGALARVLDGLGRLGARALGARGV